MSLRVSTPAIEVQVGQPLVETAGCSGFAIQLQARRHHPAESSSSSYGPSLHFRLLSTSPPGDAVTFRYKSENLDLEGTFTPRTLYTCHRTVAGQVAANFGSCLKKASTGFRQNAGNLRKSLKKLKDTSD